MSKFYGTVQGSRSMTTRCGTRNSGIRGSVQSYDGSVISSLWYNDDEKLMVSISTSDYSSSGGFSSDQKYWGTFEDFKTLMNIVKNIGVEDSIKLLSPNIKL